MMVCCGAAPEKKQRAPTAYNHFIKCEIKRLKVEHPNMTHKQAFSAAAKNVSFFSFFFLLVTKLKMCRNQIVAYYFYMLKMCSGHIAHRVSIEMEKSMAVMKETETWLCTRLSMMR